MFIYLILLAVVLLAGVKFAGKGEFNEDFLSLETCKWIQGICAVCIIFHHFIQGMVTANQDPGVMGIFLNAGYMFVSIFFFCSGYGLYVSYKKKNNYLQGFLKKRLPTVLLPLFIINTICTIIVLISGSSIYKDLNPISFGLESFVFKITTFLGITLMYSDAWYVIAISLFYIAFYLIFKNCKNENKAIKVIGLVTIIYAVIGMCLPPIGFFWDEGEWWYNSSFIFFIGIITAKNEKKIISFAKAKYKVLLPATLLGTVLIWNAATALDKSVGAYGHGVQGAIGALLSYLCKTPAEILFVAFIFLLAMKVKCSNVVINFLSKISYEIYLTHGIFLTIIGLQFPEIDNAILFLAILIGCTMIASLILKKVDLVLIGVIKNKVNTNMKELNANI